MEINPVAKPRAIYWPSFVHEQQFTLPPVLYFCTAFCSTDHKAMSDSAQLNN